MKKYSSVYTPQISEGSAFLLRRIAWAAEIPMTTTLDACISAVGSRFDRSLLCRACKDHRCLECPISRVEELKALDKTLFLK